MTSFRKYPVTIVTGFLGSGKTTLINRLLKDPVMTDTAVVINEFGPVSIDHLLVESAIENTLVLENGCICCTVRGDLVDTLQTLDNRAARGEIPAFTRVLIETTGLAEPAPVIGTLTGPALSARFALSAIVTTLDCVNGVRQIDQHQEVAKQIAAAGLVVLTKADGCHPQASEALRALTRTLNPTAEIRLSEKVDAPLVLDAPNWHFQEGKPDSWLPSSRLADDVAGMTTASPMLKRPGHAAGPFEAVHAASVQAVSLFCELPVQWRSLERWLHALTSLRGDDILRIKGLVNVDGLTGPRIVHGVQHLLHAPRDIPAWPDEDRRTRLVIIGRNLPAEGLQRSFRDAVRFEAAGSYPTKG